MVIRVAMKGCRRPLVTRMPLMVPRRVPASRATRHQQPREAAAVLFVRIFLGAVFAGNFSTIFYSAAGGVCAILVTILSRKFLTKKQLWVAGILGAIAHSVGQMAMAVLLTSTPGLAVYLPVMIGVSILTGAFTGLCAQFLVNRGNLWKITSA